MKYLIVGLGNKGAEYAETRHNIGFKVVDELANAASVSFQNETLAHIARIKYKGKQLILVKPTTYMNLSGKAVNYWMQKEKIDKINQADSIIFQTEKQIKEFGDKIPEPKTRLALV